jgi:hypothetical protein
VPRDIALLEKFILHLRSNVEHPLAVVFAMNYVNEVHGVRKFFIG